jgi:hypothetical protein
MTPNIQRLAAILCPVLLVPVLLGACGSSGQQATAQRLERRFEMQLAADISAHRATVDAVPNGARVTLLDPSPFSNTADARDNRNSDPRANLVEGLLDPSLMRIQVADSSTLPAAQRDLRVRNVVEYFRLAGLGPMVQLGDASQASSAGLTVTVTVECPQRAASWNGYDTGESKPICD